MFPGMLATEKFAITPKIKLNDSDNIEELFGFSLCM